MNPGCSGCGVVTVAYINIGGKLGCRRCYRDKFGDDAAMPLAKRCNHCSQVVHSATAPYVKTRDAYYCDEKCQKQEASWNREKRKQERARSPKAGTGDTVSSSPISSEAGEGPGSLSATSTSSPEQSKTAPFDRERIASALRGSGVDLPDGDCDAIETEPGRWLISRTVGRLGRSETGPRVVALEHGKWRVQKAVEIKGSFEFDPLSGAPA